MDRPSFGAEKLVPEHRRKLLNLSAIQDNGETDGAGREPARGTNVTSLHRKMANK
jgi:hypothetical protein